MTAAAHHQPTPLRDADYRALAGFRSALRRFLHFSEQAAREAGLTPAQHQLLLAIRGHPGGQPVPMSVLAETLQLRLHSVGELVDRAETNGLVARSADPDDHRRALVSLTEGGERKLAELTMLHRAELSRSRETLTQLFEGFDGRDQG